jgi:hypothetical protein
MIPVTLEKLDELLHSKRISSALIAVTFLIFFFNISFIIWLLAAIAVLFTVYSLRVLYQEEKYRWFFGFIFVMAISSLLSLFGRQGTILGYIFSYLPLLAFFLYFLVIKVRVREWVLELEYEREMRRYKAIKDLETGHE